jgi:fructose-bisphosphate aldolase, class II
MTSHKYDELGLVNTKELFNKALAQGFAVPAYNFNNLEQLQGILTGCAETKSPVILQVSGSARKYISAPILPHLVKGGIALVRSLGSNIPVVLHLDHGSSFELAKDCIDSGFSSVMIDGSAHPFAENMRLTKQVVEYARDHGVTVEGELGVLGGIEDEVSAEASHYTKPEEVEEFVGQTGVDSLAISIGTSHGAYKFKVKPGEPLPTLRFDILDEVERRVPNFPIVLHGASSVMPEYVEMINRYGGRMEEAMGIPEDQLRQAAKKAVCKINIDSDGRLAITATIRKIFAEKPAEFDPRKYLGAAREALVAMVKYKNEQVLGSAGKA